MKELKKEKSCGCVIIEEDKVLLIQQTNGVWGFPKGHVEVGETEIETAIREVKEETNLDVEINENKRYTMEYITDKGALKQVVLFVAKKINGNEKYQESEIKSMKWMTFEDAIKTISYDETRKTFKKIINNNNLFIEYPKCSTCKNAKKWLEKNNIEFEDRNIVEKTPTYQELEKWIKLSNLDIKKWFNTSGLKYKELKLKDKLAQMTDKEKIKLLASDGMLIKRPILVSNKGIFIGFKEENWKTLI